jgi:hypothetical protein
MTIEGQGCLIMLLSVAWLDKTIPKDRATLERILGGYSGPGLDEALTLFVSSVDRPGAYYCPDLEAIRQEQTIRHRKMSEGAKRAAAKRWQSKP